MNDENIAELKAKEIEIVSGGDEERSERLAASLLALAKRSSQQIVDTVPQ